MPKLAIREDMLTGATVQARLQQARALGFTGVEFPVDNLDQRVPEIHQALAANGLVASGINLGRFDGWLAADMATRDRAINVLREALACAIDLEADYVSFVPHYGTTDLPDLTPYASQMDLQKQLMVWLLRGISDLADAMDTAVAMQPVNHYETSFLTRLAGAAMLRSKADDHSKITIAAHTFHMALEEPDLLASVEAHLDAISVITLADNNGRLPGQGFLPFAALGEMLRSRAYNAWLVLDGSQSCESRDLAAELPACLDFLRRCDFI